MLSSVGGNDLGKRGAEQTGGACSAKLVKDLDSYGTSYGASETLLNFTKRCSLRARTADT